MVYGRSRLVDDNGEGSLAMVFGDDKEIPKFNKPVDLKMTKSFKRRILSRVFSEEYEGSKNKILDPRGKAIHQWRKVFLVVCFVSLFIDPLFFYLPIATNDYCLSKSKTIGTYLLIIRSVLDVFYVIDIFVKFHTAYVAPSSRVFGRGELVIDSSKIALRYLRKSFWMDLCASLPFPQVLIWVIAPALKGTVVIDTKVVLPFFLMFQYVLRFCLTYPLAGRIAEDAGVISETAWVGAAYNLWLYLLASHVAGACYYLLAIQRQVDCWKFVCQTESCQDGYFDCHSLQDSDRVNWFNSSSVTLTCNAGNTSSPYNFGIYGRIMATGTTATVFPNKYMCGLFWGIQQLSSFSQNLTPANYMGENIFCFGIAVFGLVLFSLFIGNVQRYLQFTTMRLEEWRQKRNDINKWMRHRQLPPGLRESVRQYDRFKWLATKGVDEEAILLGLPFELRRKIKRHLCLDLVRKVPLFDQMDEPMLDGICERLKPALCTQDICLVREGDPVKQMLFIIRGHLDSYTTDGGRAGFFNSIRIGPGDFCGDELLTWALDPRPTVAFPSSTRTVKAITEVEAFALLADDLKFVASQFRRLHSKKLRHTFRFYSPQWRTWAACFIQAAWRRHKKWKNTIGQLTPESGAPQQGSFWSRYAESLVASTRSRRFQQSETESVVNPLEKPTDPDFSFY